MEEDKYTQLGKKILYTTVILLSGLLILLGAAGILGVWLVEGPLSDSAVAILGVVEDSTTTTRAAASRVDQGLGRLQEVTSQVQDASQQLSQNVTDKGLVMVLLPEEREQNLIETAGSIRDSFTTIRDSVGKALDLYRSVNRLPFVNLPTLDPDQVESIENSVAKTQALAADLRTEIADFRSRASGGIDKVTEVAGQLSSEITQSRERLAQLDARLAALAALADRLQQVIPGVLLALAVIFSLLFAFLIFTQVEVIRLYVQRWRQLSKLEETGAPESLAHPIQ